MASACFWVIECSVFGLRAAPTRERANFRSEIRTTSWNALLRIPDALPPKTQAFWEIVDASRAPEDAELTDAIDLLGLPPALTLSQITVHAEGDFAKWLRDRANARRVPHRLEACGYVAVRKDGAKDGLWKTLGKRQVIYAKAELALRDRIGAARQIAGMT